MKCNDVRVKFNVRNNLEKCSREKMAPFASTYLLGGNLLGSSLLRGGLLSGGLSSRHLFYAFL